MRKLVNEVVSLMCYTSQFDFKSIDLSLELSEDFIYGQRLCALVLLILPKSCIIKVMSCLTSLKECFFVSDRNCRFDGFVEHMNRHWLLS